jgi:hypothetical protein
MTLEEIRKSDKVWLTPSDVAEVLGCDPHSIRIQAHTAPERLGFPVCVVGSRTKIPRKPFLAFVD